LKLPVVTGTDGNNQQTDFDGDEDITAASGNALSDIVSHLKAIRTGDEERDEVRSAGVLREQFAEVKTRLLSFGTALGGDPETVADLPFTEEAGKDHMPEPLYVRQDTAMLNQVTSWLLQDQHIGLVSPYGTGKTAFREIVCRDLGEMDEFIVTHLDNPRETTTRNLYVQLLERAREYEYEIETEDFWQTRDGIPWATEDAKTATKDVVTQIRRENRTLLLIVDEIEVLPKEILTTLQVAADIGVRLFLLGTPEGKDRVADLRETLDSRLRYYEGIDPFSEDDVAEYVARSLAYFRDEPYNGQGQQLFTRAAIADVHDRTGGKPREVRIECRELFTRAAFVWYRTGQDIDRIQVVPELRHRRFGMSY
jgi:type II secretory pathway predicted ATPase ExeA